MFGTIAFLYFAIFRRLPPGGAMIEPAFFTHYTTQNRLWWAALAACIVLGCALVGSWPGKGSPAILPASSARRGGDPSRNLANPHESWKSKSHL